jgi:phosphatidylglycerol lysyltransferase
MAGTWLKRLGPVVGVALFIVAAVALHRAARGIDVAALRAAIHAIPVAHVLGAAALTLSGYVALTFIDFLACLQAGRRLPWRQVAFGSFIGHAFTHTLGNALLVGGGVRYRLYSAWGLSTVQVAAVVAFCFIGFWVGFLALAGGVLVARPPPGAAGIPVPGGSLRLLGALLLAVPLAWLALSALLRRPLRIGGWSATLPPARIAAAQVALGALEMWLRALVLWLLLPESAGLGFSAFLGVYLLAMVAGKLSQVPGGIGVLEGVFVLLVPSAASAETLGALAVYRVAYYLGPLVTAAVLLGGFELAARREGVRGTIADVAGRFGLAVRHIMAGCAVLAGAAIVVGAVLPGDPERVRQLGEWLDPRVSEAAQALCGAVGIALLVAARGLQRKLAAGWRLAVALMFGGAALALLSDLAVEEATALALLGAALLPCRRDFHRGASLDAVEFIPGWIACFALVLIAAAVGALFALPQAVWSPALWWTFGEGDDAARALRAFSAAVLMAAAIATARSLRPAAAVPPPPSVADLEAAAVIARGSPGTLANLALLGDKLLLFGEDRLGFVMYRIEGRSWVALGDPVGPPEQRLELAWRFRDLCDHHDGRPVFFQAAEAELYADLGLSPVAIGEEARVPLARWRPDGAQPGDLGCDLVVEPPERTLELLPELKRVADAWVALRGTRADGFAHGHFDPSWLARFPVATLRRRSDGRLIAFGEVWAAEARTELSLDLVRLDPGAPDGALAALFRGVMAWGAERGFATFSFGMAPLKDAPFAPAALAPADGRLGRRVFAHGEHFPTPSALRAFVAGFAPRWETRWLLSRSDVHVPRVLRDIVALAAPGPAPSAPLEAAPA